MKIEFTVEGEIVPTQSVRARIVHTFDKKTGEPKEFISFYQPKKIKDYKAKVAILAREAMEGVKPLSGPLRLVVVAIFKAPKSMTAKTKDIMLSGGTVYKHTKPDITDNILKGITDAMEGIVFENDSQISIVGSKKIYGMTEKVIISIETLPEYKGGTLYG